MPTKEKIYVTEFDLNRLRGLIGFAKRSSDKRLSLHLQQLDEELDRAEIIKPEKVPPDVVTMNSTFRLGDLESGEEVVYTVVFPAQADFSGGKISVLAPIGTAILGYRVGDIVEWRVPAGTKRFKIEELLYQPEAALNYQH
jgi:regulator of nucleoside diphosphate kinase